MDYAASLSVLSGYVGLVCGLLTAWVFLDW